MKSSLKLTLFAFVIILITESSIAANVSRWPSAEALETEQRMIAAIAEQAVQAKSEEVFDAGLRELARASVEQGLDANINEALDRIITQVDGEQWQVDQTYRYGLIESLVRSQGLATDGKNHFWFSGTASLLRAKSKTGKAGLTKLFPLPKALVKLGDDHVGDIDYYDGTIYAPGEDGKNNYKNPYVILYDAQKLTVKSYFRLPVAPQAEGVPWVAVEPAKNRAFSALYYNVNKINVYDLKTFAPAGEIDLSQTIHSWQGAKVHDGFMYATSDGDANTIGKHVFKINLDTGTVIDVATLPSDVTELEGLAFSTNGSAVEMDVLGIVRHGKNKIVRTLSTRAQLHMYKRTTLSLRDQVREALKGTP